MILNTEVNKNNRRYNKEVLDIIRDQINSNPETNFGTIGYTTDLTVPLCDAAFRYSNAVVENNSLYADIETLSTPKGIDLLRMVESEMDIRFRPAGMATIKGGMPVETLNLLKIPNIVGDDYKLISIAAINPEDDAVNFN